MSASRFNYACFGLTLCSHAGLRKKNNNGCQISIAARQGNEDIDINVRSRGDGEKAT